MKKTILLSLLSCSFSLVSPAQAYDLNNYKYRFQKVRGFSGSFNFDGTSTNNGSSLNSSDLSFTTKQSQIGNGLDFNGNTNYFRSINLGHIQSFQSFTSELGTAVGSNRSSINLGSDSLLLLQRSNNLNFSAGYANITRFYKKNTSFTYLRLNAFLNGARDYSYRDQGFQSPNTTNRSTQINASSNFSIGKGKGRLENVSDAVTALFIIKDLQKKGDLKPLSNTQIESIAKGITTIRNRRFLDFRFRLIDQISLLDSVFSANESKPENELVYFTTLYDNWLYATEFFRSSGKRFTYYIQNDLGYNYSSGYFFRAFQLDENSNTHILSLRQSLNLEWERSKQKNIHWQNEFRTLFSLGLNQRTREGESSIDLYNGPINRTDFKNYNDFFFSEIRFILGKLYQANTRTFWRFHIQESLTAEYDWIELRTSNPTSAQPIRLGANTFGDIQYFKFFSPRLSLEINGILNLNLRYQMDQSKDLITSSVTKRNELLFQVNPSFQARLFYAIF